MISELRPFFVRGNTARIQYRILEAEFHLLADNDLPGWMENQIWVSTFDNLQKGNGHGRILMQELRNKYPNLIIGLYPAPSNRLREYYAELGFQWEFRSRFMFLPTNH